MVPMRCNYEIHLRSGINADCFKIGEGARAFALGLGIDARINDHPTPAANMDDDALPVAGADDGYFRLVGRRRTDNLTPVECRQAARVLCRAHAPSPLRGTQAGVEIRACCFG